MGFIVKNSLVFEVILILGFAASIIFVQYWGVTASLGILAMLYFLVGLKEESESTSFLVIALIRVFGVSYAIAVVGILFQLIDLPGADSLLITGLSALVLSVFVSMFAVLSNNENSDYLKAKILRGMALAIFIALLLLFPGINIVSQSAT